MPDWKTKDSSDRLLAAVIASLPDGFKLDHRLIATHFGQNATYDAIEGRCRGIKKEAAKMKAELANGSLQLIPARGNSVNNTPRKPRPTKNQDASFQNGVLNGRVSKPGATTPTRKRSAAQVKRELLESSTSASTSSAVSTANASNENDVVDDSFFYSNSATDSIVNCISFEDLTGEDDGTVEGLIVDDGFWDDETAV